MTTPKIIGAGLEDVGVPGRNFLRNALTSCTDPLKAIEEFQLENGILLPSLRPMLPLLDLHGVRRLDFHTSVLEELRDRLVQHINEIGQKEGKERDRKLKELLAKSFPVVRVKALRPVVMCILRNTPHIDDKYLKVLVSTLLLFVRDRELYNDTDTEVKRQIWKDNQSLFGDEVSPLLSQYIKEKETVLFDHLNLTNLFFTPSPKVII
uniref:Uncharacterized protein n=1 Tax=Timema cristinae TaxID=61476 RepID=A0A7R9CXB1_TIMCR|nr:unnamed protein product [Timema cristinae]